MCVCVCVTVRCHQFKQKKKKKQKGAPLSRTAEWPHCKVKAQEEEAIGCRGGLGTCLFGLINREQTTIQMLNHLTLSFRNGPNVFTGVYQAAERNTSTFHNWLFLINLICLYRTKLGPYKIQSLLLLILLAIKNSQKSDNVNHNCTVLVGWLKRATSASNQYQSWLGWNLLHKVCFTISTIIVK